MLNRAAFKEAIKEAWRLEFVTTTEPPAEVGKKIDSYIAASRHENRCKMFLIQESEILGVLNFHRAEHECQCLPVGGQIPADAIVEAAHYALEYRGFLLRVWSASYPIVPPGDMISMADQPNIEVINMRKMALVPKESLDPPYVMADFTPEQKDEILEAIANQRDFQIVPVPVSEPSMINRLEEFENAGGKIDWKLASETIPCYSPEQVTAMEDYYRNAICEMEKPTEPPTEHEKQSDFFFKSE